MRFCLFFVFVFYLLHLWINDSRSQLSPGGHGSLQSQQLYANKVIFSVKGSVHLVLQLVKLCLVAGAMVLTSLLMSCLLNVFYIFECFFQGLALWPYTPPKKPQMSLRESFQTTQPEQTNLPSFSLNWGLTVFYNRVMILQRRKTKTKQKTPKTLCLFQLPTRTCITRAERTKLHLQVLCVRLNVKQIQTWRKKSQKNKQKTKKTKKQNKNSIRVQEIRAGGGRGRWWARNSWLSLLSRHLWREIWKQTKKLKHQEMRTLVGIDTLGI